MTCTEVEDDKSRTAVQRVLQSLLMELCRSQYMRSCPDKQNNNNKRLVNDFRAVCLQETRTCSNRPLVRQVFSHSEAPTVVKRH